MKQNLQPPATPLEMLSLFFRVSGFSWLGHYKIFCVNGKYGIQV